MSFGKSRRFNEIRDAVPPVGSYDPRDILGANGLALSKSERFLNEKEFGPSPADFDISCCSAIGGISIMGPPTDVTVCSSTPHKKANKDRKDKKSSDESILIRDLELEIKKLLRDKMDLNKQLSQKEGEVRKLEGRLQHSNADRTTLLAKMASLEKDIKDINKSNCVLKQKLSTTEGTVKKHETQLQSDLADTKAQLEVKEREITLIQKDLDEAVSSLLDDLQEVVSVTNILTAHVSELEQSFDDKDVDSTEHDKEKKTNSDCKLGLMDKVQKARRHTKTVRQSLEEVTEVTDRKVQEIKCKMREKFEGIVAELQKLSEELLCKEDNLTSAQHCNEALKSYKDALRLQTKNLQLAMSRLKLEHWDQQDNIRSMKGEIFVLSDQNTGYKQGQFESNAEVAAMFEKIEILEEKEDLLNTNIRSLTEKYHVLEQALVEERKSHRCECEQLEAELGITQQNLEELKHECDSSQKTKLDLIHSLNNTKDESERLHTEIVKSKSLVCELQNLLKTRREEIKEKDSLIRTTQESHAQETSLRSSQLENLQSHLVKVASSESNLRSQLSDVTASHKKTVEVYLEQIRNLESERYGLLEEKHDLFRTVDELATEKTELADAQTSAEDRLRKEASKLEGELEQAEAVLGRLREEHRQTEIEMFHKFEGLEQQLKDVTSKSEADLAVCEQNVRQVSGELTRVSAARAEAEEEAASLRKDVAMVTEELNAAMEDVTKLEAEKDGVEREMRERLVCARNELTHTRTALENAQSSLTQELQDSQDSLHAKHEQITSLKQTMAKVGDELRGHLVTAEGEATRLRETNQSQLILISKLEKERDVLAEEKKRLQDEKEFDHTCTNEKFAELDERAREDRRLFEELKSDFASRLEESETKKTTVIATFELYRLQAEEDIQSLKTSLVDSEARATILEAETRKLQAEFEKLELSSEQSLGDVRGQLVSVESEVASLMMNRLDQEQLVSRLQAEKRAASAERERCVSEYNSLSQQVEQLRDQHEQQVEVLHLQIEDQHLQIEEQHLQLEKLEQQTEAADVDSLRQEIQHWQSLYEQLQQKVAPFMAQIDAFEAERQYLLGCSANAQAEVNKLSMEYAKLIGHQNQKQKIKHIEKIKQENNDLKQDVQQLRECVRRLKKQMEKSEDKQGRKRFDPSKAFQNTKENKIPVMSPLRDGNRL